MKINVAVGMSVLALAFLSCQDQSNNSDSSDNPFQDGKWIDLSYSYDSKTIYWPTEDGFQLDTSFVGETEKGYYYSAFSFKTAEHGGTHMDAPVHFAKGAHSVEEVPLSNLTGNAVVINLSDEASSNSDFQVGVKDIKRWESENGELAKGVIVLLNTGHAQYWPDRKAYLGTDLMGPQAVAHLHFPGIDPKLAAWLVENRNIKAIGIDTPSIDYGQSTDFLTHRILFKANIPAFENVANLDQISSGEAYLVALPMKIKGGSGAPIRIAAFINN